MKIYQLKYRPSSANINVGNFDHVVVEKLFLHIYIVKLTYYVEKVRKSSSQLNRILGRDGADTRASGHFYVTVVQAIQLFGLETWLVTTHIKRILGGFHYRVAH